VVIVFKNNSQKAMAGPLALAFKKSKPSQSQPQATLWLGLAWPVCLAWLGFLAEPSHAHTTIVSSCEYLLQQLCRALDVSFNKEEPSSFDINYTTRGKLKEMVYGLTYYGKVLLERFESRRRQHQGTVGVFQRSFLRIPENNTYFPDHHTPFPPWDLAWLTHFASPET